MTCGQTGVKPRELDFITFTIYSFKDCSSYFLLKLGECHLLAGTVDCKVFPLKHLKLESVAAVSISDSSRSKAEKSIYIKPDKEAEGRMNEIFMRIGFVS